MQPPQSSICRHRPPEVERGGRVRQTLRVEHDEKRLDTNADITRVSEGRKQGPEMRLMLGTARIGLLDQNPLRRAVPNACPGRICPTYAERKIRSAGGYHLIQRTFENSPACEPI